MSRAFNFCAGPATLPEAVLKQAQSEMLDWRGTGMSVMEMSHRSDEFVAIAEAAEKDLRELAGISDDYAVLFMQGGASSPMPDKTDVILEVGPDVDYQTLVSVMDTVRSYQAVVAASVVEAELFPDVSLMDAGEDRNLAARPMEGKGEGA